MKHPKLFGSISETEIDKKQQNYNHIISWITLSRAVLFTLSIAVLFTLSIAVPFTLSIAVPFTERVKKEKVCGL